MEVRPDLKGAIVVILGVLAVSQAAGQLDWRREYDVRPVKVGEPFGIDLLLLRGGHSVELSGRCQVLFIIDPACPACNDLALRYSSAVRAESIEPLWVSVGAARDTEEFAERGGLDPRTVAFVQGASGMSPYETLGALGTPATPTRVVVTAAGIVSDVLLTWDIPTRSEFEPLCAMEGSNAPS